jgi:hypothetical protein
MSLSKAGLDTFTNFDIIGRRRKKRLVQASFWKLFYSLLVLDVESFLTNAST